MGRELKRVALDFEFPDHKIWTGYINPFYEEIKRYECIECSGSGYSHEYKILENLWYKHSNSEMKVNKITNERLRKFVISKIGNGWSNDIDEIDIQCLIKNNRLKEFDHTPTIEEVNKWSKTGIGHDSINSYTCIKNRLDMYGLNIECNYCKGSGQFNIPEQLQNNYENWESYEPPIGEGFQLWETTSEGSPISPVFKSLEELCEYAELHCSTFASYKASKEEWFNMLSDGLVIQKVAENVAFI